MPTPSARSASPLLPVAILAALVAEAALPALCFPEDVYWANDPPDSTWIQNSDRWAGIVLTGRYANYEAADTWYPSWATDGTLYSAFADGWVGGLFSKAVGADATTGHARIVGEDPMRLTVEALGVTVSSALPYGGRYPSANLLYNGVWYHGTYVLDALGGACGSWCVLGPFVGFHVSSDLGQTWTEPPHSPEQPLFGAPGEPGGLVRLGPLHFVDFGRNLEHSPDGKAYLVGHGSEHADSSLTNWIAGDDLYLIRVTPRADTINEPTAYEYFAGRGPDGGALWTHDLAAMQPLLEWKEHLGSVSITYDAPLRRYLMVVSRPRDGFDALGTYDTFLLESDALEGEWRLVHYLPAFGAQAYFVNVPSKFIAPDGLGFWLAYSANFAGSVPAQPLGSEYALSLHEIRLRPATVYLAAVEQKRLVVHRLDNGVWTTADRLALPQGGAASKPAVTMSAQDRLDVFLRGPDGSLRYASREHGTWSGWLSLGGQLASAPDATSWGDGRIDVVARAPDDTLRHIWFDRGAWSGWESMGGRLRGDPAIASWGPGRLDVFARGRDGTLQHRALPDGETWTESWEDLGGRLVGGVDAVSAYPHRVEVVGRGPGGTAVRTTYDGARGWSSWENLGGQLHAGPSIASSGSRRTYVFGTASCRRGHRRRRLRCRTLTIRSYDGSRSDWAPFGDDPASGPDAIAAR